MTVERTQYPGMLAWGLTTHKSQGSTYSSIVADMTKPTNMRAVSQGLIYTMLSRAKSSDGVRIVNFNPDFIKVNKAALTEMTRMKAERFLQWKTPVEELRECNNDIIIGCLNIRSLGAHLEDMCMDPSFNKLSAICLTETHVLVTGDGKYESANHKLISNVSPHGTAVYVKNCFTSTPVILESVNLEYTAVAIKSTTANYVLVTIYRPPKSSMTHFMNEVHEVVKQLPNEKIILCGDFNLDLQNLNKLTELLKRHNLRQMIKDPTHVGGGILDIIFTPPDMICTSNQSPVYYSDHYFLYLSICKNM